jgi:hypothetical protein
MTEDVASQTGWTTGCVPVIVDAVSQTYLIAGLLPVTEFTDPFATMTKGVASLDYWSTDEVADS